MPGDPERSPTPADRDRLLARLARWRSPSPRVRGVLLVLASAVTVAAVVLAVRGLDLAWSDLRLWPLVIAALVATPLTIGLNAAELRATALATGADLDEVGWGRSLRTVVLATAANLLPVPAGAALRVQVLHAAGARLTAAAGVQLSAAAVWIGMSLLLAGLVLLPGGGVVASVGAGTIALLGGFALVAAGLLGVRRTATSRPVAAASWLALVELLTALLHAVRLWIVLLGIGVVASVGQAAVIATASPLAAAAGFFPGGIGLAELLSALLAPLAGLSPAAGLLAVAVARLLGLAVTVPVALALGLTDLVRRPPTLPDPAASPEERADHEGRGEEPS